MADRANMHDVRDLLFTAGEVAALLGCGFRGEVRAPITGVAADSREVLPGTMFVALPGERTDGHAFIAAALAAGASCVLAAESRAGEALAAFADVDQKMKGNSGTALILVENTMKALQSIAREHRRRHPSLVRVGVTGSSGKTTTKECIGAILGVGHDIVMNPGNLNSDVGLSLSMFGIRPRHQIGIFEMGMNRAGEMDEIVSVLEPDLALITNVGTAHIGILGSRDAIAEEKKKAFALFSGKQTGFVWEDDDYNAFLKRDVAGSVKDFGFRTTRGFMGAKDLGLDGYLLDWEGLAIRFPLVGRHNLLDALAAISVARELGTSAGEVAAGLESVKPLFGRSEILRGEFTVIRDCYNANPDSVEAAIGFCDAPGLASRRIYVLGSMLELGAESRAAHGAMGTRAGRSRADALFFFGDETADSAQAALTRGFGGPVFQTTDFDALRKAVTGFVKPGDLILLKASRGMMLERLADDLADTSKPADRTAGKDAIHAA